MILAHFIKSPPSHRRMFIKVITGRVTALHRAELQGDGRQYL